MSSDKLKAVQKTVDALDGCTILETRTIVDEGILKTNVAYGGRIFQLSVAEKDDDFTFSNVISLVNFMVDLENNNLEPILTTDDTEMIVALLNAYSTAALYVVGEFELTPDKLRKVFERLLITKPTFKMI